MTRSNYPYFQDDKYMTTVHYTSEEGLSDEVTQNILRSNAG